MNLNDYPSLKKALSAEKRERIQIHTYGVHTPSSNRERFVQNPFHHMFEWVGFGEDGDVNDLVTAATRADSNKDGNLKAARVYALLASSGQISTQFVMGVYDLEERQARRYVAACKLAIYLLKRHFFKQVEVTVPRYRALTLAEIRVAHKEETNGTAIQP